MIPLDAKPGTEIICINDAPTRLPFIGWWPVPFQNGELLTLRGWRDTPQGKGILLFECVERCAFGGEWAYNPSRFRLLDIPPSLTGLLAGAGVNVG